MTAFSTNQANGRFLALGAEGRAGTVPSVIFKFGPQDMHDYGMPHFPQAQTKTRAPRVRVPNDEAIRFDIGGHLIPAVLQKLSMTGGLAQFRTPLGDVTIAEVRVNTACGPVSGLVEFLRPQKKTAPHTYAFRFLALSDEDYKRLDSTLKLMRTKGLAE